MKLIAFSLIFLFFPLSQNLQAEQIQTLNPGSPVYSCGGINNTFAVNIDNQNTPFWFWINGEWVKQFGWVAYNKNEPSVTYSKANTSFSPREMKVTWFHPSFEVKPKYWSCKKLGAVKNFKPRE